MSQPVLDHAARRAAFAAVLGEKQLAAALVTRLVNVRYLTGLASSNAAVLVGADGGAVLATDGRYATQAGIQAPDVELVITRTVGATLAERAAGDRRGGGGPRGGDAGSGPALGVETHDLTVDAYAGLGQAAAGLALVALGPAVEGLRHVKDEGELALLARACAISCGALEDLLVGPFLGRTEQEVARDLEWRMFGHGADGLAFATIVAAGPHSAVPHHSPTDRKIAAGDLLKIDFGATFAGYHADCTRTMVVGRAPADWQRDVYDVVATAQRAATRALAPAVACTEVDEAARAVIRAAGHGDHFTHGTGHGVGLEIHEAPTLGYSATGTLDDRVPVTVEPGVYLPGRGGVRIEDVLVLRPAGPDLLTPTTKELLVVGA